MQTLLWTLAFFASTGFFIYQVAGRLRVLFKLKSDDNRNYSLDTLLRRLQQTAIYAFGQYKFFRDGGTAGFLHIIIFWGFTILFVQVVTMFARGWIPEFHLPGFEPEYLGGPYAFIKDFFQLAVLGGVLVLLYRWLVLKPQRLFGFLPAEARLHGQHHTEAIVILCSIGLIMISGFLYDAGRIVGSYGDPEILAEARWQPITWLLTGFMNNPDTANAIAQVSWWIHNGVILIFLNILPRSKHFHILTAIPNVFLGKVEPRGRLRKPDFASETPSFGRSTPMQFTWKQALDMYSCTECGRCSQMCPATASGKPLAPRQLLLNLRDHLYSIQDKVLKPGFDGSTLEAVVGPTDKPALDDVLWSCNACRACEEACPVNIEYVDKIIDMRQHLVQEASRFPEELGRTFKGLENNSNPWGIGAEERDAWATGLDIPRLADKPDAEYLYYVGCGGAFDSNNRKTTQSFTRILKSAGVSFAILGKEELCNGETARRLGNEYLFQTMAQALVDKLNGYNVKKILVNCPHCFNTMANEYPEFGGKWEVIRAGTLVGQLIREGKVSLKKSLEKNITYHDSCYYGRFNDVFDEPRDILNAVPGAKVTEMKLSKEKGSCCGAGGGRMWMEEKADQRVNHRRMDQITETKADIVATSCPYCRIMLGNAATDKGIESKIEVKDVMQLVAEQLD